MGKYFIPFVLICFEIETKELEVIIIKSIANKVLF